MTVSQQSLFDQTPAIDLEGLNPAQREAVECTRGPLLVLAGAGSGKTRVLTYRIAHMIADEGVRPWQVLAITFTNKAAAEMRERLEALLPYGTRGMWVCTFHAMCVRILREDGELVGYRPNFTIYDDDDSRRLVKTIMADLDLDQKQFPMNSVRAKISAAKNALVGPDELASSSNPADRAAARVYRELDRRLARANAMDFDDLLVKTFELLSRRPEVLERYQDRFRQISVDEYQDTNHVQYAITNLLAARYRNLMVVGGHPEHPGLREGLPGRPRGAPRAELPLHGPHPGRGQRRGGQQRAPQAQAPLHGRRGRREDPRVPGR